MQPTGERSQPVVWYWQMNRSLMKQTLLYRQDTNWSGQSVANCASTVSATSTWGFLCPCAHQGLHNLLKLVIAKWYDQCWAVALVNYLHIGCWCLVLILKLKMKKRFCPYLFIYSFIHSFIYLFIYLLIYSFQPCASCCIKRRQWFPQLIFFKPGLVISLYCLSACFVLWFATCFSARHTT